MFQLVIQHFWLISIFIVVGNAVAWRVGATGRIKADPSLRKPLDRLYGGFAFWTSLPFLVMGAGIVTGYVSGVFPYLVIDFRNPFITAFHAVLFVEDALFVFWVFYWRGDHLLALHTEIVSARPKFRIAVRIVAIALPLVHAFTLYQTTSSPHFGQFFGANGI